MHRDLYHLLYVPPAAFEMLCFALLCFTHCAAVLRSKRHCRGSDWAIAALFDPNKYLPRYCPVTLSRYGVPVHVLLFASHLRKRQ
ncbi:hypothetical protein V8C26DRAFT_384685 [Trichoderma gracile]